MLSPAPVPASAGVEPFFQFIDLTASLYKANQIEPELSKVEPELGTAQPQLVFLLISCIIFLINIFLTFMLKKHPTHTQYLNICVGGPHVDYFSQEIVEMVLVEITLAHSSHQLTLHHWTCADDQYVLWYHMLVFRFLLCIILSTLLQLVLFRLVNIIINTKNK